jgi:hypothetical protein
MESVAERLARPQNPMMILNGKPVKQTGMILPYGRGGYRHEFSGCGCMGSVKEQEENSTALLVVFLVAGAALAYTLLLRS